MNALVSVIMPAKNTAEFIRFSIDSVLNQTYQHFELIIIDDGSDDDTRNIINRYDDKRIKVIDGESKGISAAFNLGLNNANGEYLCRCDSDDIFPSDRLEIQVACLNKKTECIAVCGSFTSIDLKGRHIIQYHKETPSRTINDEFSCANVITHFGTFLCRTSVLKEINGCRLFFITAEDIDLQLRLSEKGSIYFMSQNFYHYRLHKLSITHTQSVSHKKFFEELAKECHLQRLAGQKDIVESGEAIHLSYDDKKFENSSNHIYNLLTGESWYWHDKRNKRMAIKSALRLFSIAPMRLQTWKNLVLIVLKPYS
ncbi:MAG TPA: glycosyltransferase [Methylophaga aminisulfidivorans]|uniref:glycosyltransferase n=1 Tax=Methylophaga TaxID=40222 RepID=UPI00175C2268|nr:MULTISPECIES: glycosyltransferase [Methylophaga]HIC46052.1 glycosyltransferase [Methylophaga sp.]HIM39303.1 glycosyltransferase [Methylophaga aminisulfidivorans]